MAFTEVGRLAALNMVAWDMGSAAYRTGLKCDPAEDAGVANIIIGLSADINTTQFIDTWVGGWCSAKLIEEDNK